MMIDWLWGTIAAVGGIIIVLLIAGFFIASAFTLLAAKIVKVENATFGRAMLPSGGSSGCRSSNRYRTDYSGDQFS